MRIKLLAEYPFSIVYGGLELQCMKTFSALKKIGVPVELLDYHKQDNDFDILHIIGSPARMYEVCLYTVKTKKIIISAVCGASKISSFRTNIRKGFSKIASIIHEKTDYSRLYFMFQSAKYIICLNEHEKIFIHNRYDIPFEKLAIIPNGVENHFFNTSKELFISKYGVTDFILFTGNIVQRKNPLRLALALSHMRQKGVFVGGTLSVENEYAEQFAKVISASDNLLWIKGLPYDSSLLASAYSAARVFCLPSSNETQSLSALEAMAAGKPIILGDFPYAYLTPFEKALRCNPMSENSIESCIKVVLKDPDRYSNPLPYTYTWESIAREIVNIYEKIINE